MDTSHPAKRHCPEHASSQSANWFWEDVKSLYDASDSFDLGPLRQSAAFHVQLDGRCHRQGEDFLLSGCLLASWFENSGQWAVDQNTAVVVRIAASVYESVARYTNRLRILQASVKLGGDLPVIDTCTGLAVVAGAFIQQQHTQLEVAELFQGVFADGVKGSRSCGPSVCR